MFTIIINIYINKKNINEIGAVVNGEEISISFNESECTSKSRF